MPRPLMLTDTQQAVLREICRKAFEKATNTNDVVVLILSMANFVHSEQAQFARQLDSWAAEGK